MTEEIIGVVSGLVPGISKEDSFLAVTTPPPLGIVISEITIGVQVDLALAYPLKFDHFSTFLYLYITTI